jgi:molybdopterin-guanine dinucleotide biosynthesis protein A
MSNQASSAPKRAALILAGGKSSRLGRDKAQLPLGNTTVIEFLIARLRQACEEVIVVTRPEQPYPNIGARVVFDVMPGKFSLGGLYSGLLQSPAQANFVCACDMPLILPPLVAKLFERLEDFDVVVPRRDGQVEPLCAVYTKVCLPVIHARLLAGDLRMSGWLESVRTRFVEKDELRELDARLQSFFNLNTEADYQQVLALLENDTAIGLKTWPS